MAKISSWLKAVLLIANTSRLPLSILRHSHPQKPLAVSRKPLLAAPPLSDPARDPKKCISFRSPSRVVSEMFLCSPGP